MFPSRSACTWRSLKIRSCFLSPLTPFTFMSRANALRSAMVIFLSAARSTVLPFAVAVRVGSFSSAMTEHSPCYYPTIRSQNRRTCTAVARREPLLSITTSARRTFSARGICRRRRRRISAARPPRAPPPRPGAAPPPPGRGGRRPPPPPSPRATSSPTRSTAARRARRPPAGRAAAGPPMTAAWRRSPPDGRSGTDRARRRARRIRRPPAPGCQSARPARRPPARGRVGGGVGAMPPARGQQPRHRGLAGPERAGDADDDHLGRDRGPTVQLDVATRGPLPAPVGLHGAALERGPRGAAPIEGQGPPDRGRQLRRLRRLEHHPVALRAVGGRLDDRVGQPARLADDGDRPVPHGDHLPQPARLEPRRHEEQIAARVDLPRQPVVERQPDRQRVREPPAERLELLVEHPVDRKSV